MGCPLHFSGRAARYPHLRENSDPGGSLLMEDDGRSTAPAPRRKETTGATSRPPAPRHHDSVDGILGILDDLGWQIDRYMSGRTPETSTADEEALARIDTALEDIATTMVGVSLGRRGDAGN